MAPATWPANGCIAAAPSSGAGMGRRSDVVLVMSDGAQIAVAARSTSRDGCAGAVVLTPPGFESGLELLDSELADALVDQGLTVVAWDPRGRGDSEGAENANGPTAQADAASVFRWAAGLGGVSPDAVVVISKSFGISLAAGALARNGDLRPVGWVDIEGPGQLTVDLAHADEFTRGRLEEMAAEAGAPEVWWAERSAAELIDAVTVPYHRVQGLPDHALGTYMGHAEALLNAATSAPEVTCNTQDITPPITEDEIRELAFKPGLSEDDAEARVVALGLLR